MGQLLVIKFRTNNELLGCLYFYSIGFTDSAIEEVNFILNSLGHEFPKNKMEMGEFFIRAGYDLDFGDKDYVCNRMGLIVKTKGVYARNGGFFVLSDPKMKGYWEWKNYGVEINLRTGEIDCSFLLGRGWDFSEYIEFYSDDDGYFAGIDFKRIDSMDFFKTTIKEFNEWSKGLLQVLSKHAIYFPKEEKVFRIVS